MGVELRQLRALVAVVEEGTFTDAAIALRTSQASVSRSISSLERAVGARLLQRTSRHVSLTVAGRAAVGHARRALAEATAVETVAAAASSHLRVGYAWAGLGRHTTAVQRRWAGEHPECGLVLVQSNTATAGLLDGAADVAVLRRAVTDPRFHSAQVGVEERVAALPADHSLARRRSVTLAECAGTAVAVDPRTGTTDDELWPAGTVPTGYRDVHGVDEWLTVIAAGQAVGITTEATAGQYPRPGIVYRPVRDAPSVAVSLAWWRDDPPPATQALVALLRAAYA